jgi:hypothetical protein
LKKDIPSHQIAFIKKNRTIIIIIILFMILNFWGGKNCSRMNEKIQKVSPESIIYIILLLPPVKK